MNVFTISLIVTQIKMGIHEANNHIYSYITYILPQLRDDNWGKYSIFSICMNLCILDPLFKKKKIDAALTCYNDFKRNAYLPLLKI
jgi:hypothetical protein